MSDIYRPCDTCAKDGCCSMKMRCYQWKFWFKAYWEELRRLANSYSSNGLFILDEISTEVLDRLSNKDAVPVTSFSKNNSLKGNITSSDDVFIAPLGGVPYRFPVMCTPAISHSTTYTYIKAKEGGTSNANQQTDTPAP